MFNQTMNFVFFLNRFHNEVFESVFSAVPVSASVEAVKQYFDLPLLNRKKNPLDFWKHHENVFPELTKLTIKYLKNKFRVDRKMRFFEIGNWRMRKSCVFRYRTKPRNFKKKIMTIKYSRKGFKVPPKW